MTANLHVVPEPVDVDEVLPTAPTPADVPHVDGQADSGVDEVVEFFPGDFVDGLVASDPLPLAVVTRSETMPPWATSRRGLWAAVCRLVDEAAFRCKFHTAHTPVYAWRLHKWAPRGWWRATRWLVTWIGGGSTARPAIAALTGSVDRDSRGTGDLAKVLAQHRRDVRARLGVTAVALVAVAVALVWVAAAAGLVGLAGLWSVAVTGFGLGGRPLDRKVLDRAVSANRPPAFTSELIASAMLTLGIGKMNTAGRTDPDAITFVTPVMRDGKGDSAGYRVELDLPRGVTAGEVANRREALASALRRPLGCVWPAQGDRHAGHLVLFVSNKALAEQTMPPWPLGERGTVNIFEGWPLGVDQTGRQIKAVLAFVAWLVGAQPRMGKTAMLRLIGLAALLDVRVKLYILNCKGGADFHVLRPGCHFYASSARANSRPGMLAALLEARGEMERRYDVLEDLAEHDPVRCPEGKITDELASDRALGLEPIVVIVDECHMAFGDALVGDDITEVTEDLARRGPAVLITLIAASQRLDKDSIPRGISTTAQRRFCLKTGDVSETDLILGTGANRRGAEAHTLGVGDVGIGYMTGEGIAPQLCRTFYVDLVDAAPIVARAVATRRATGRLTGMAAGEDAPELGAGLAERLDTVWPDGAKTERYEDLAVLLTAAFPGEFDGWAAEQVSAGCRALGLPSVQVARGSKTNRTNRKGIARKDLDEVLNQRAAERAQADNTHDDTDELAGVE